jgi:Ser/Thr protein kinase RdoA (MazF antagonist)
MMRLSLMDDVFRSEEQSAAVGPAVTAPWNADPSSIKLLRASANFVFTCRRGEEVLFIRCNRADERSAAMYADEVKLLQFLTAEGVPVVQPVASGDGSFVWTVRTGLGPFVAVAFAKLVGAQPELEELEPARFSDWGAVCGRLHQALKTLGPDANGYAYRPSWEDLLRQAASTIEADETTLRREWDAVWYALSELPQGADARGLIHYDLQPDNVVWTADGPVILDFDDAAKLWYGADIAYALRDLFTGRTVDVSDGRLQEFMRGYRSETELREDLAVTMPLYYRLHRLVMLGRLRRSCDLGASVGRQDWAVRLYARLTDWAVRMTSQIEEGIVIVN